MPDPDELPLLSSAVVTDVEPVVLLVLLLLLPAPAELGAITGDIDEDERSVTCWLLDL